MNSLRAEAQGADRCISSTQVNAQILANGVYKGRHCVPQYRELLRQRSPEIARLRMKLVYNDGWIEIVLVFQKRARGLNLHCPRLGGNRWEIPLVVGDDHSSATLHSRGENMAVFWMVSHSVDQR